MSLIRLWCYKCWFFSLVRLLFWLMILDNLWCFWSWSWLRCVSYNCWRILMWWFVVLYLIFVLWVLLVMLWSCGSVMVILSMLWCILWCGCKMRSIFILFLLVGKWSIFLVWVSIGIGLICCECGGIRRSGRSGFWCICGCFVRVLLILLRSFWFLSLFVFKCGSEFLNNFFLYV